VDGGKKNGVQCNSEQYMSCLLSEVEVLRVQEMQKRRSRSIELLIVLVLNSKARRRKREMLFHPDLFNFLE